MLCHTLKIAPGSVASGFAAKFAAASDTAYIVELRLCYRCSVDFSL